MNRTQITSVKSGKRKQQYVVIVKYKDDDGKMHGIELSRQDIAKIVKVALE